jgi:hypothetical protein
MEVQLLYDRRHVGTCDRHFSNVSQHYEQMLSTQLEYKYDENKTLNSK